ncbi:peptide deformylase [Deltaproteobacteria bacterium]|nr:peptide deformylase [Deltaproteobacteria bacterium]
MPENMKICTYPDSILRTKSMPVQDIDENIQILIENMAETMYAAPGIGLAAVQVGEPISLIVYDLTPRDEGRKPSVLINPEIILAEDTIVYEEACLSVVDFSADVTRSARVKVRGVDRDGNPVDIEAEDLLAICLQHEIDHLNGVLFIDHISILKRSLYKKRLKKNLNK